MRWEFHPARQSFPEACRAWDAINRTRGNHILLDSGFVAPLLRHFANGGVTLGVCQHPSHSGMALLIRKSMGQWETYQPSQAPIGLFLLAQPSPNAEQVQALTRALPGYALQFCILQQDPDYASVRIEQNVPTVERVDYIRTARITLAGTFEEYWKKRGTNLRHNLARRRRRLQESGLRGELVVRRSPKEVAAAIREYGLLESRSWKASQGTAVEENNAQGRFYREILEHFCARGEGVILQFLLNGKVAATDLCLLRNGMFIILKTTYNTEYENYSPAFLMREDALRLIFAEGQVRVVEFYGRLMDWHTRWTDEIRTLYHVNCFRHSWVKSLKQFARRFA